MSSPDPSSEEGLVERYPHYRVYKRCQSRAFTTGSVTLLGGAAISFLAMDQWYQRYKPSISKNWLVAGPLLCGTVTAYVVTMAMSAQCKNMWMAMEERHSVLTPAEERLAMRIEAEK